MTILLKNLIYNFEKNLKDIKSSKTKYNEHSTRVDFIDPFFEALGWDISNSKGLQPAIREVIPEDYIKSVARPDYTFAVNGIKKFFVEAKKPSVDILKDPEPAFQTRSYGWSAGHFISILTNFEYLLIYDTTVPPKSEDPTYTALIKKFHFTEYLEKWDEINELISRHTLYSGKFDENFNHLLANRDYKSIDDYFLKQINEWRIQLANELIKRNADYSLEYINDVTQNFINQMVFLRICEDRNLPIYHKLQETIIEPTMVKNELLDVLKAADEKYNSGLFEDNLLILELSEEIILDIIKSLYYPQSPFVFSVIEANILGEIYELFLAEKLTLSPEGTVVLTKKKENINRDIVSTPIEIVKIMVKKALEPLCKGKSPEEILDIKVADIASGSGIFLIEVFDFLIETLKEWYMENKPNYLLEIGNAEYSLPFEDKKQILLSCIFGIDIDPNAVEVAKFSLLLKLLENETTPTLLHRERILPYLDGNIKQGNALVDYSHIQKVNLNPHESYDIAPFDWEFKEGVKTFNVIIGNPPYVTTEDMVNLLPELEYEIYKKKYNSSYKQFDKYFIFIERALEKLEPDGLLCYIVPNKFSKIKSGEKLRKLLTKESFVKEFIDFNSAQLFKKKGVTTYSSILLAQKRVNTEFVFEEVSNLKEWWANQYGPGHKRRIILDSRILSESSWVIVSDIKQAKLINKLYENANPLGKGVADIFNGIQTSAESPYPVYWFSNEQIIEEDTDYIKVNKNEKEYLIEKSILRPYFKPTKGSERNMKTYDPLIPNKWIIFPYDVEGKIISPFEMEQTFPFAYNYLKQHYNRLVPKQISGDKKGRDVPHATSDTWYHYGRIQALTRFINTPKLIVGILTKNPLYIYDNQDMLIASGGTAGYCAIAEKEGSLYQIEFIQAVLSHPVIEWLTSIIGSDFDNDFHSRGTAVLENIPIVRIDFNNEEQANLYYNIVDSTRRIYSINEELKKKHDKRRFNVLLGEKEQLIKLTEENVSKLYGIENMLQVIT